MGDCSTCKWWKPRGLGDWENEARGDCRGAPPHIKRIESGGHYEPAGYRIWPVTDRDDFCKAHEPAARSSASATTRETG